MDTENVSHEQTVLGSEVDNVDTISVASYESGDEETGLSNEEVFDIDTSSMTFLTYDEIDYTASEFRILTLNPANDKRDDVYCTLERASLGHNASNRADYEALSYVWGDTEEGRLVYVNGRPLPITPNLDIALRYLRYPSEPCRLWIDAICIDQSNLSEKTHQVSMIREIYQNASQVLVWLGESDRDIRKALALLVDLRKDDNVRYLQKGNVKAFASGLTKIFKRPWWSRLWVVQEVLVANRPPLVGCGRQWVSWERFETAILVLVGQDLDHEEIMQNPMAVTYLAFVTKEHSSHSEKEQDSPLRLQQLLKATCNRETTQPHDKVFALLGLTDDRTSQALILDYNQPCEVTYQKAMVYVLESEPSLDFLVQAMNRRRRPVPSWCVDFSHPNWNRYTDKLQWFLVSDIDGKSGASGTLAKSTISHNLGDGTLEVSISRLGQIRHVTVSRCGAAGLTKGNHDRDGYEVLPVDEQARIMLDMAGYVLLALMAFTSAAKEAWAFRFGRTAALQRIGSGEVFEVMNQGIPLEKCVMRIESIQQHDYSALEKFAQIVNDFRAASAVEWSGFGTAVSDSEEFREWGLMTYFSIGLELVDKSLFTTDAGYLGSAPTAVSAIMEGDLLCIIHGCRLPAVLRPEGRAYRVVTFSYVSDVMHGEYFDAPEWDTERILLC